MAKILGVGIATLDIINETDGYPAEDSEQRALAQRQTPGGNVSNSLRVLTQFGHQCHLAAVLAPDAGGQVISEALGARGLDLTACHRPGFGHTPTSYITVNRKTGSRTIVHYRDLPEFGLNDFLAIDLSPFDWLHFEGRHCMDTAAMMALAQVKNPKAIRSLEVEKERPYLAQLFPLADVLFLGRAFAESRGLTTPEAALTAAREWAPQAVCVLAWGSAGAFLQEPDASAIAIPSEPIDTPADSVGAGDTLIAGSIHARLTGQDWPDAVTFGARLAERKLRQIGLDDLNPDRTADTALCRLEDLGPADAIGVAPVAGVPSVIVVRDGRRVQAFRNVCPHNGSPLARGYRGYTLNRDGTLMLRCTVHNARFTLDGGICSKGPCPGEALTPVPIRIEQGQVLRDAPAPDTPPDSLTEALIESGSSVRGRDAPPHQ